MKKRNYISPFIIALALSSCMTDPIDTSYSSSSSVVGYQRGDSNFASADLTSGATIPQSRPEVSSYSSLANSDTGVIKQGAIYGTPQPVYQMVAPVQANSYPVVGSAINTTANGVPVTINNPVASPYSSLSSTDSQVIQRNVFGTQPQQAYVPAQPPYYGAR